MTIKNIQQANKYAITFSKFKTHRKKNKGVIFVEDNDDKKFWAILASQHIPQLYSENGKIQTGKGILLKKFSQNQLIAIDSDLDFICPKNSKSAIKMGKNYNYILQTYVYALENLIYTDEFLNEIFDIKFQMYEDHHTNNIAKIIENLSTILFKPYTKYLFLKNEKIALPFTWEKKIAFCNSKDYKKISNKQVNAIKKILALDFKDYEQKISLLNSQLEQILNSQDRKKYLKFYNSLQRKGLKPETTLFFVRGHDVEDFIILPLLYYIVQERLTIEETIIKNNFHNSQITARINNLHNNFNKLTPSLEDYFIDVYIKKAMNDDYFLKKIVQHYNSII